MLNITVTPGVVTPEVKSFWPWRKGAQVKKLPTVNVGEKVLTVRNDREAELLKEAIKKLFASAPAEAEVLGTGNLLEVDARTPDGRRWHGRLVGDRQIAISTVWSPTKAGGFSLRTAGGVGLDPAWWECVPQENYPRWTPEEGGDGQCTRCSGWGCCACSHTGGY